MVVTFVFAIALSLNQLGSISSLVSASVSGAREHLLVACLPPLLLVSGAEPPDLLVIVRLHLLIPRQSAAESAVRLPVLFVLHRKLQQQQLLHRNHEQLDAAIQQPLSRDTSSIPISVGRHALSGKATSGERCTSAGLMPSCSLDLP